MSNICVIYLNFGRAIQELMLFKFFFYFFALWAILLGGEKLSGQFK